MACTDSDRINTCTDLEVLLQVNNGVASFYENADCTTPILSKTISSGHSESVVYISSPTGPQSLTLIATSSIGTGSLPLDIGGPPERLILSGSKQIIKDTCSPFTVKKMDLNGFNVTSNLISTADVSHDGTGSFYADADCTMESSSVALGAESSSSTIYFKALESATVTITLTDRDGILASSQKSIAVISERSWWNEAYRNRVPISINNLDQNNSFKDIPVLVHLRSSRVNYNHFMENGEDIRFVTSDGQIELPYEIEKWDVTGTSYIWVKIPDIPATSDDTYFYLYYNNQSPSESMEQDSVWASYYGVWHFKENGSENSIFTDSTNQGHHGTIEEPQNPYNYNSKIGNGADLSGPSDTIDFGVDLAPVIGRSSTFSCWVKTKQVGHNTSWRAPGITGVEGAGNANDIFFGWIDATGRLGVNAGNGAAAKSDFIVNDDTWRHITITRSESDGAVKFYINGVENGSGFSERGFKSISFQKLGTIRDTGGTPTFFEGLLDEVRIVSSVMDSARIRADYKYMMDTHLLYHAEESF